MENSLCNIKDKLEKYKSTHPNLYIIFKKYIENYEKNYFYHINNLISSVNNLENIEDLTNKELLILYVLSKNFN